MHELDPLDMADGWLLCPSESPEFCRRVRDLAASRGFVSRSSLDVADALWGDLMGTADPDDLPPERSLRSAAAHIGLSHSDARRFLAELRSLARFIVA